MLRVRAWVSLRSKPSLRPDAEPAGKSGGNNVTIMQAAVAVIPSTEGRETSSAR